MDARISFPGFPGCPFHLHHSVLFQFGSGLIAVPSDNLNVLKGLSEMSEKLSEKSEMSELVFASEILKSHIAPPSLASSVGARILAASRKLKWSFNRTRDVWYADQRVSIKPKELRKLEEVSGVEYGQQELNEVERLINNATKLLGHKDPHISGSVFAALRSLIGAMDRPGA